jgi:hypothetical protein
MQNIFDHRGVMTSKGLLWVATTCHQRKLTYLEFPMRRTSNLYAQVRIAVLLHKPSCFPDISSFLEECCRCLYDAGEHPYDKCILHLFQLQVIAEKINSLSWENSSGSVAEIYISSIKSNLQRLHSQLPTRLSDTRE